MNIKRGEMNQHSLSDKYDKLKEILHGMQSILVAFSGGIDSTLILKSAINVLPTDKVLAVTAFSPIFSPESTKKASALAQTIRAKHLLVPTHEMNNPEFIRNGNDRCYFCKCELFFELKKIAETREFECIVDGTNLTDMDERRKSLKAHDEFNIRMPLVEASLNGEDVSKISEAISLPGKDEEKHHCLASRLSHDIEITEEKLMAIYNSEKWLKERGFSEVVVRHHLEDIVRIKMSQVDKSQFLDPALINDAISELKKFGYKHVVLDLE